MPPWAKTCLLGEDTPPWAKTRLLGKDTLTWVAMCYLGTRVHLMGVAVGRIGWLYRCRVGTGRMG